MDGLKLSRRSFTRDALRSLVTFSLLEICLRHDLFAGAVRPVTDRWLKEVNGLCADLHVRALGQADWQSKMEELFARVDLPDLLRSIDFDRLVRAVDYPDDRAAVIEVDLPRLTFDRKIFALRRGRAIVPHGHRNMVSGHIVIKGRMHVRHFDRLRDEPDHLVLLPTIDREASAGDATTISEVKDNVHWFRATSETAATFDVIADNLDPSRGFAYRMDFVDPDRAEVLKDGTLRARRLDLEEALRLYGRS
jgi:hypothetical protein